MDEPYSLVTRVIASAEALGYKNVTPIQLSNGANLLLHLAPYPIVARIAKVIAVEGTDACLLRARLAQELHVANHLLGKQVPIVRPIDSYEQPIQVGGTWMSLWEYITTEQQKQLPPAEACQLLHSLSTALSCYQEPLPVLGVWHRSARIINDLNHSNQLFDSRLDSMLYLFACLDQRIQATPIDMLVPAHGDAHSGNLLPASDSWRWNDFEDVCLMPRYWDYASFVSNRALFGGLQEPVLQYLLQEPNIIYDMQAFAYALAARTVMATLGNLALAQHGAGDLPFANKQLELCGSFLQKLEITFNIKLSAS